MVHISNDIDGFIFDTRKRSFECFKDYAKQEGVHWPYKTVEEWIVVFNEYLRKPNGVQAFYDAHNLDCDMNDQTHKVWAHYNNYMDTHVAEPYDGMIESLQKLWEFGHLNENPKNNIRIRLAINTTNSWKAIYSSLKAANAIPLFDCFITKEVLTDIMGPFGKASAVDKPAHISTSALVNALGTTPSNVIHGGDTLNDTAASKKVYIMNPYRTENLSTICGLWGYEDEAILRAGMPTSKGPVKFDLYIEHPSQYYDAAKKLILLKREQFMDANPGATF